MDLKLRIGVTENEQMRIANSKTMPPYTRNVIYFVDEIKGDIPTRQTQNDPNSKLSLTKNFPHTVSYRNKWLFCKHKTADSYVSLFGLSKAILL